MQYTYNITLARHGLYILNHLGKKNSTAADTTCTGKLNYYNLNISCERYFHKSVRNPQSTKNKVYALDCGNTLFKNLSTSIAGIPFSRDQTSSR